MGKFVLYILKERVELIFIVLNYITVFLTLALPMPPGGG